MRRWLAVSIAIFWAVGEDKALLNGGREARLGNQETATESEGAIRRLASSWDIKDEDGEGSYSDLVNDFVRESIFQKKVFPREVGS